MTLKNVLEPLRGITAKLQKRDLDIYKAFCYIHVHSAIDDVHVTSNCFEYMRYPIFAGGQHFLELLQNELHRANLPANNFLQAIYSYTFDEVLAQLKNCFSEDTKASQH